jgi:hypothetical protein
MQSWYGLGNVDKLKKELVLVLLSSWAPACWSSVNDRSYGARDKLGELLVRDARIVVVASFKSGENVEQLGGLGSARVFEKPRPTFLSNEPFGDSSWIPTIAGLGERLGGPRIVGARDIRTQFCRRWPFLALGLPFIADGFPEESGVTSH